MAEYDLESRFEAKLKKLLKKDKKRFKKTKAKMNEIASSEDIGHYKNLKKPMQKFKRVQIGSFVLIFEYDRKHDVVKFWNLKHHDDAYK